MSSSFTEHLKEHYLSGRPFFDKAWNRFLEKGLPEKKEAFQYVPLSSLYGTSFSSAKTVDKEASSLLYPECQNSCIVFVNGAYSKELSCLPKQLVALPLKEAMVTYGNYLTARLSKQLQEEKNPFVLLNAALGQEALFLYIPPKLRLQDPIQILHLTTLGQLASPRLHCFVGASSAVSFIVRTELEVSSWTNSLFDLAIEEGASAECFFVGGEANDHWHFQSLRATLKRDSILHSATFSKGCRAFRQDASVSLCGENASATLKGLWKLSGQNQAHTHVVMDHLAPHCHSMQHFKGLLDDVSQSSFEGKIWVRQLAQKTQAYQLNNNLLLGEGSLAYSKPNLEVLADDVKASHGSTTSSLNASHLLYLKTRGLDAKGAKQLLVEGFCKEILGFLPYSFAKKAYA